MKMHWAILFCLLFVICFYQKIIPFTIDAFTLSFFQFVPSMFPLLFFVNLFLESDGLLFIYKKAENNRWMRRLFILLIYIISICLGIPSYLLLKRHLEERKILSKKEAEKYCLNFGSISFSFFYGVIYAGITNYIIKNLLLIIYLSIPLFGFKSIHFSWSSLELVPSNKNYFQTAIKKTIDSFCSILVGILLFSIPQFLLPNIGNEHSYFIKAIIEFSIASCYLVEMNTILAYLYLLWIILVPSLSTLFQAKLIDSQFKIVPFIRRKLCLFIFSLTIFLFILCFLI